jgi:hypothetical protein
MKATFKLYAVSCIPFGGLDSEHTFIISEGHNFNCFGRGAESIPESRVVCETTASAKWAERIYGEFEGSQDQTKPAAGVRVRYDGVCQNAANRLLVLGGDGVDARQTKGNVLATLLYGKFGFNIDKFLEVVTRSGNELVQTGEIDASDVAAVIQRIKSGLLPDAELEILHADIPEQLNLPKALPELTDNQRALFRPIYADYQQDRLAAFDATPKEYGEEIAWKKYPTMLVPALTKCMLRLQKELSRTDFEQMFGVEPEQVIQLVKGMI